MIPLPLTCFALVLALTAPADPPPPRLDGPVGGYWAPGERPRPEPPDGHAALIVAGITLPLGILGAAGFAGGVYAGDPSRCERLTGLSPDNCRGLYILSWVRVAYGALMAASGAVFLGVGLARRKRHREWERRRDFSLRPSVGRTGADLTLSVRF